MVGVLVGDVVGTAVGVAVGLADGIAGATAIYKHRGAPPPTAHGMQRRVSIRFVMDISGSMYTFNRLDGRKTRLLETALFFMQVWSTATLT